MLSILNPKRALSSARQADYHLMEDDAFQVEEKGDSLDSTAVDSGEDEAPMIAPPLMSDPSSSKAKNGARRAFQRLAVLLPSFLHRKASSASPSAGEKDGGYVKKAHPTAWLDGLRGIAAFFVVWHHTSLLFFSWDIHSGWKGLGDNPVQLPILRLAISGLPNVYVFFVVSGYALSYKPLKLLRLERPEDTCGTLASSAFRRHSRLFMPAAAVCFFSMLMARLGWFGDGDGIPGAAATTMGMPHFDTLWGQLWDYVDFMLKLTDPFRVGPGWWPYNEPLWTLPVEFRCSFVIFGLLLAVAGSSARTRFVLFSGVAVFSVYSLHLPEFLFCGGMLVAALRLHFDEDEDEATNNQRIGLDTAAASTPRTIDTIRSWWAKFSGCRPVKLAASVACFAASLHVLSMPKISMGGDEAAGFRTLARLIPERYYAVGVPENFWLAQGAVSLLLTVDRSPPLQKLFTNCFAQYLGRISYSLYLIHGLLLQSVAFFIGKRLIHTINPEVKGLYILMVAFTAMIFWTVLIWAADLGWRFIDSPSVRFSSWLQRKLCRRDM
ncbi:hypothetical protein SLS62_004174 [Diatrype stigma]|uniref:Acyltransferase 3 domain-containing protein n=1 Tax=Diatrype stigma TaxID=117547 RepID=A0AAN9UTN0_9PEZI